MEVGEAAESKGKINTITLECTHFSGVYKPSTERAWFVVITGLLIENKSLRVSSSSTAGGILRALQTLPEMRIVELRDPCATTGYATATGHRRSHQQERRDDMGS